MKEEEGVEREHREIFFLSFLSLHSFFLCFLLFFRGASTPTAIPLSRMVSVDLYHPRVDTELGIDALVGALSEK